MGFMARVLVNHKGNSQFAQLHRGVISLATNYPLINK